MVIEISELRFSSHSQLELTVEDKIGRVGNCAVYQLDFIKAV